MIRAAGFGVMLAALAGLVLALLTLNYVLLLVGVGAFAFVAAELLAFPVDHAALTPEAFAVEVWVALPRLPLHAESPVSVSVEYRGNAPVFVELVDVLPSSLAVVDGSPRTQRWLSPGDRVDVEYRLRANERGRHDLGPTVARVLGPLGLAFDEVELLPARPLLVTASPPNPRSSPSGLALYTRVRGRLALRNRGYGSEFRSLRAYDFADDIRHVAWRRSTPEALVVREFEQESRQDYLLVFDVSPPMQVGQRGVTALDRAAEAGAVAAGFVERNAEDRIGLLTYSAGVHQYLKPGRGSVHFRRLNDNLALVGTRPGTFDLADLLEQARRRLRVHTHLFVFSTLSEPLGDLHTAHTRFVGRGHHLYLFAAQPEAFYPGRDDPEEESIVGWARDVEESRLARRLSLLHAEGIPTFRYDRRGATPKVIAAYGQVRAWGRAA
ncbi:MAG: DUF58 domain-containing protein [Thermoplasmata archaeon]|nr:DUF58 domain-containing protein [Thermoplasmata archaeon]